MHCGPPRHCRLTPHASGFRKVSATCSRQSLLMCCTSVALVGVPSKLQPSLLPVLTTSCLHLGPNACDSAAGHAGMEAAIANVLEPGETIIVGNSGIWGQRVCDLSERYGGQAVPSFAAVPGNSLDDPPATLLPGASSPLPLQARWSTWHRVMGLPCPLSRSKRQCQLTSQQFCSSARCSLALTAVDVAAFMWLDSAPHKGSSSCTCHAALPPGTVPPVYLGSVPSMLRCPQN